MRKERAIATLDSLPSEFAIEELVEKLIFIEKIEEGLKQIDSGAEMSLEEAKKRFTERWQNQ